MPIKVVELFAGVGGFRIGLEEYPRALESPYHVVWSNQWEPSTKRQHASEVYEARWPEAHHTNRDIEKVIEEDFDSIPDHDLLVGGFPCQDYSVATSLKNSKGLRGKKGVLWWSIEAILRRKGRKKPKYLMLENVDRLLNSPASQRGRDFAIILSSLNALDYAVEWRVINAADYGMPQRRRRIFIMAFHKGTAQYQDIKRSKELWDILTSLGCMSKAFPVESRLLKKAEGDIDPDLEKLSADFKGEGGRSPFQNSGYMVAGRYYTARTTPEFSGPQTTLGDVLLDISDISSDYFIDEKTLREPKGWEYQKGAKTIERTNAAGHRYTYSEGGMCFPDILDKASRTIITGEGGPSPSRFKHVVEQEGRLRRLMPIELERLNMFPDDHTYIQGMTDSKRAFFMGNALVVGVVERLAEALAETASNDIPDLEPPVRMDASKA